MDSFQDITEVFLSLVICFTLTSAAEGGIAWNAELPLTKIGAVQPESMGDADTKTLLLKIKSTSPNASLRGLKIQVKWIAPIGFPLQNMSIWYFPGTEGGHSANLSAREESSLTIFTTALAGPWQNTSSLSLSLLMIFWVNIQNLTEKFCGF